MIFARAYNVIVLQPRKKKNKNKVVCIFRTSRKRIDHKGRILYTYDDIYGEFITEAFEKAQELKHKDRINIKRGVLLIEGEKLPRLKVFDYEMSKKQKLTPEQENLYYNKIVTNEELKYF